MTTTQSPYHSKYRKADKEMVFNDDDTDLKPIHYQLPSPPPLEETYGYGLPPEEQYWKPFEIPPRLKLILKDHKLPHNKMKVEKLENEAHIYEEEIKYILDEWERVKNGFWMFIKGKQYFIPGHFYFYLQYWSLKGNLPEFRMRDLKFFTFWWMVKYDKDCTGFNYPKHRQEGATSKVCCIRYVEAILTAHGVFALQSKDEDHAEEVHRVHMELHWNDMPFWFKPVFNGNNNSTSSIEFTSPKAQSNPDFGAAALNSVIIYTSSDENALDGYTPLIFVHNDEVGKTTKADIHVRYEVQKLAMYDNSKLTIHGKCINTSTVEKMEKGGGQIFYNLCKDSDYHKRSGNNRTTTWLYTLFIPAWDGVQVDKYGFSDKQFATQDILNQRVALAEAGDIDKLIDYTRAFPLRYRDCWRISQKDCNFNLQIIQDRLDEFFGVPNKFVRYGNFEWKDGIEDSTVVWKDLDPTHKDCKFTVSYLIEDPRMANRQSRTREGVRFPTNTNQFCAGADPYKFDKTKTNKKSKGAGMVYRRRNHAIDPVGKDPRKWVTDRFCCSYNFRPKSKRIYGEDMIKMCVYYGCKLFPEVNVPFLWDHFDDRGYGGYLYYTVDRKNKVSNQPGTNTTGVGTKDEIFRLTESHIEANGMREVHTEWLEQCKDIVDDMSPFDLFVAGGMALMLNSIDTFFVDEEKLKSTRNIARFLECFNN